MSDDGSFDCSFVEDCLSEGRARFTESIREQYASDASAHAPSLPDAVVWPQSTAEVSAILAAANERSVPVTPWSGGSGLEGNAIPVNGGVLLNTAEMVGIEVHDADLSATVAPGVVYDELNETLARYGLRFPPGISSGDVATIGGMIANNASGFNAVRYGETRDHVRRLEVVLSDGRILTCGRNVVKTSAGYSLKDLFVGSEGTLGVVTEATLSVTGIPDRKHAVIVTFPSEHDACRTVSEIIRFGLRPGAIEYVDAESIGFANEYDDLGLEEAPTLIIELHGNNDGIEDDVAFVRAVCEDNGAGSWRDENRERMGEIWQARRDLYFAYQSRREEWSIAADGDVVVPISKYPEIVETVQEIAERYGVPIPCCGHAGDGNLHYSPLVDTADEEAVRRVERANSEIIHAAIAMGGTSTGEHGIGLGKTQFLETEHGETAVDVMRMIKDSLDPNGIMNPGKVLPDE